jgi:acyl-CoA synthetase (AMP-forming)/AMP-acid ligase II
VSSILKLEGHRATTVETPEQLASMLKSARFDVVIAASSFAPAVELLVGSSPERPVVVTLDPSPKPGYLIDAIDRAVERHDQNIRKTQSRL